LKVSIINDETRKSGEDAIKGKTISIMISFVVGAINFGLRYAIRIFSHY
jgi:hypothetical protein